MGIDRDTRITWYGHACVEIVTPGGRSVLIDPWFGNPKSPRSADIDPSLRSPARHPRARRPHGRRRRPRLAAPAGLAVHPRDEPVARAGALPGGNDQVTGMNKGGTLTAAGLRVTMTAAEHSAGDWNPDGGVPLYLGEPAGFVVEMENGFRVYHAGDTAVFGDMALIRDLYHPDLALLPIGGHYTMGPREAALAVGAARGGARPADPLRDVPGPRRDPGRAPGRAGRAALGAVTVHELAPGETLA